MLRTGVAETSGEDDAAELVQSDGPHEEILHRHVPDLEAGSDQSRGHFAVAVRTFLSQHGYFHVNRALDGRVHVRIEGQSVLGVGPGRQRVVLRVGAHFDGLLQFQFVARLFPHTHQWQY